MTIPSAHELSTLIADARARGDKRALADALEHHARSLLAAADPGGAALALGEAAACWRALGEAGREASCLLLAASAHRLAGEGAGAAAAARKAAHLSLAPPLARGFALERCEQALARGDAAAAHRCFAAFLDTHGASLEPLLKAQILQRCAAAAMESACWQAATESLDDAASLLDHHGRAADAEAVRLAAVASAASADADDAEARLAAIERTAPQDGAAAARRGLVGGELALRAQRFEKALERFDRARQGALDAGDVLSYYSAALLAARAAEELGDPERAYARLATAWGSLTDVLGRALAAEMVRPALLQLRARLGSARFDQAKAGYEALRRQRANATIEKENGS